MKTTVEFQPLFSYASWPIAIVWILFMAVFAVTLYLFLVNKRKVKDIAAVKPIPKPIKAPARPGEIKQKYLNKLAIIHSNVLEKTISVRESYEQMSMCIRQFVYEMTGIKVTNYTLEDVKQANMTQLAAIMEEYYAQQFVYETLGDSLASIEKTKRIIEKWS